MAPTNQRLEHIEAAMLDEPIPLLPHIYWETVVYFKVFGKLGNSKLLCDVGVVKQGHHDSSSLLCDNHHAYCAYLVRRDAKVCLEFWNGPDRDVLPRSIPIMDVDKDKEKTIKLGFYYDAIKRQFAIVSPISNVILCQFTAKFPSLVPQCGLYSFDQCYVAVKLIESPKVPKVLSKLMKTNS